MCVARTHAPVVARSVCAGLQRNAPPSPANTLQCTLQTLLQLLPRTPPSGGRHTPFGTAAVADTAGPSARATSHCLQRCSRRPWPVFSHCSQHSQRQLCADGRLERTGRGSASGAVLRQQHSMGPEHAPCAAVVIIGDEILAGKVTDANSPFLSARLHALGWRVTKIVVLPDSVGAISRCAAAPCVLSEPVVRSCCREPRHQTACSSSRDTSMYMHVVVQTARSDPPWAGGSSCFSTPVCCGSSRLNIGYAAGTGTSCVVRGTRRSNDALIIQHRMIHASYVVHRTCRQGPAEPSLWSGGSHHSGPIDAPADPPDCSSWLLETSANRVQTTCM